MSLFLIKGVLFSLILLFLSGLFTWVYQQSLVNKIWNNTKDYLEDSVTKQRAEQRKNLILQQERKGLVYLLEKRLLYSGLSVQFPLLTPVVWLEIRLALGVLVYIVGVFLKLPLGTDMIAVFCIQLLIYVWENVLMQRNYNRTDDSLLKLLDCLGNYSITTSEITWIFNQISEYMENPVKRVMEECCTEAQMTGDTSMALLYMAEKLQHPKFRELIRNLEVAIRYSADLTVLTNQSRRTIAEYMRMRQERKSMVREAWINFLILGGMALIILKSVEALLGIPVQELLFHSLPGMICICVIIGILFLFYRQIKVLDV